MICCSVRPNLRMTCKYFFSLAKYFCVRYTKYRLRLVVYGALELLVAGHQVVEEPPLRAAAHVHCIGRKHSSQFNVANGKSIGKT